MSELALIFRKAIERARNDPEWFLREILNAEPEPWQVDLINAVHDVYRKLNNIETVINHEGRNRVSIRSGHGTGKTYGLALVMHHWGFINYGLGVATAPKMDQITKRLWPRYRDILRSANPLYRQLITTSNTRIIIADDMDNGFTAETASDPDNLAGFHAEPQLFVIDEAGAQALDPMFPVIEGALSTPGSVSVEIGNPTRTEGEFFQHHNKSSVKKLYFLMHIKPSDSRFVADSWQQAMLTKYGKQSPIYQVRVLGNFATMADNVVFHYDYVSEIYGTTRESDGSTPTLVISGDVADGGADLCVATIALHYDTYKRFIKQVTYSHPPALAPILFGGNLIDLHDQYKEKLAKEIKLDLDSRIIVDGIGVGAGTIGHIRLMRPDLNVISHKGGNACIGDYRNQRVKCYYGLADDLSKNRIVVDADFVESPDEWDEFCDDLMAITKPNTKDLDKVNDLITKREYKIKKGKSPDRPDSVAMQYSECDINIENEVNEFITFGAMAVR